MNAVEEGNRKKAIERIQAKREFQAHVLAYVAVNAALVAIWFLVGGGFFWPIIPILGWGIGVLFHALDVYREEPTEEQIQREMKHVH
jgi:hypothetical protein